MEKEMRNLILMGFISTVLSLLLFWFFLNFFNVTAIKDIIVPICLVIAIQAVFFVGSFFVFNPEPVPKIFFSNLVNSMCIFAFAFAIVMSFGHLSNLTPAIMSAAIFVAIGIGASVVIAVHTRLKIKKSKIVIFNVAHSLTVWTFMVGIYFILL